MPFFFIQPNITISRTSKICNISVRTLFRQQGKTSSAGKGRAWSVFWKLDRVWKSPASLQRKVQLFKASSLIVLLYGCKSWVLTSDCQLDSFQTSCLRIIFGVPRTDHVSNEEVYDRTGTVPLSQLVKARLDQIPGPLSSAHPGGH